MHRLGQIAYLFGLGALVSAAFALSTVAMIEARGPSERQEGQVLARTEGAGSYSICPRSDGRRLACRAVDYPTFSVIGERADGSGWVVTGEAAFDAMESETNVVVRSSSITGRVIALTGANDSWAFAGGATFLFLVGTGVVSFVLVLAWEYTRLFTDRWSIGRFQRKELWALVPAIVVGLTVAWFILFWKTSSLELPAGDERFDL